MILSESSRLERCSLNGTGSENQIGQTLSPELLPGIVWFGIRRREFGIVAAPAVLTIAVAERGSFC